MADDLNITPAAAADLSVPGAAPAVPAPPPMSMQEAADRKSAFLADKTKTTALMNGDVAATSEWRLITENLYQAPQVTLPRDEVTNHLQESAGHSLSPEILDEFRRNDPVAPDVRRATEALWEDRKSDPDWIARFNRNEIKAKKEWALITSILSRPVRDASNQGAK
jgi:hypothetical protein